MSSEIEERDTFGRVVKRQKIDASQTSTSSTSSRDKRSSRDSDRDRGRDRDQTRDRDRRSSRHRSRSRSPRRSSRRSRSPRRSRRDDHRRDSRHRSSSDRKRFAPELVAKYDLLEKERRKDKERPTHTILCHGIHPDVTEKDIFEFFSIVGTIADINLIRDQLNLQSKGIAYVEFWDAAHVIPAQLLEQAEFNGVKIKIRAVETMDMTGEKASGIAASMPTTLTVQIANVSNLLELDDLREMLTEFGTCDLVWEGKAPASDDETRVAKAVFEKPAEGRMALQGLNGMEFAGHNLELTEIVPEIFLQQQSSSIELAAPLKYDDVQGGIQMDAQARQSLYASLSRGGLSETNELVKPSSCVLVTNMFDPSDPNDEVCRELNWQAEVQGEVQDECAESLQAPCLHCYVDPYDRRGCVYIRFASVPHAEKVIRTFNGRYFAGKHLTARFFPEQDYDQVVSRQ